MSELKVYHHELRHNEYEEFYLKYEADKVIAEKDEAIEEMEERIDELQKATDSAWSKVNAMYDELRHNKYKRCMAMAWFCHYIAAWDNEVYVHGGTSDDRLARLYWKWEKRWLELAEKFKEAK